MKLREPIYIIPYHSPNYFFSSRVHLQKEEVVIPNPKTSRADHRLNQRSAITKQAKITEAMPLSVAKARLTRDISSGFTIQCS